MSRFRSKNAYGLWSQGRNKRGQFVGKGGIGKGTKIAARLGIKSAKNKVSEHNRRSRRTQQRRDQRRRVAESKELTQLARLEARDAGLRGEPRIAYVKALTSGQSGNDIIRAHGNRRSKASLARHEAKMAGSKL